MVLQTNYNLNLAFPGSVLLINKFDRSGNNLCSNRIGNATDALSVNNGESIIEICREVEKEKNVKLTHILCDEAQFFLPRQVDELAYLVDYENINVVAYGLLTNYKGKIFLGSQRFIELADRVREVSNEMRCWCGKPATHNSLMYTKTKDVEENEICLDYEVVCRKHFMQTHKSGKLHVNDDGITINANNLKV